MLVIFIISLSIIIYYIGAELDNANPLTTPMRGDCPTCAEPIESGWLACPQCRTLLRQTCRACGKVHDCWVRFCPWCGDSNREPSP